VPYNSAIGSIILAGGLGKPGGAQGDDSIGTSMGRYIPRGRLFAWILLALCFACVFGVWAYASKSSEDQARERFEFRASEVASAIEARLGVYELALRGGLALFSSQGEVSRKQWRDYVNKLDLQEDYPGIQGIGYSPVVAGKNKNQHIEAIRGQGFPNYTIRPSGERLVYTPVIYLEPDSAINHRAFGYDTHSEPVRREAIERACDTGKHSITGMITLVQENTSDVQNGFIMFMPVYSYESLPFTVEERRKAITGYVNAPFRMTNLMKNILGKNSRGIEIQVYDIEPKDEMTLMYSSKAQQVATASLHRPMFTATRQIEMFGRTWRLKVQSTNAFEATVDAGLPRLILISGLSIAMLLFYIHLSLTNTRERAEAIANGMTGALRESEENIRLILESSGEPLYGIDTNGECTFCNTACLRVLGYSSSEELLGRNMHDLIHHTHPDGSSFDVHDCRIFQAFLNGEGTQVTDEVLWRPDGTSFPTEYWSYPQFRGNVIVGAVVVFRDVTEKKRTEQELQAAYMEMEQRVEIRTGELAKANSMLETEVTVRKQAHREVSLVLSAISSMLVSLDNRGCVSKWNEAAFQAFSISEKQSIGSKFTALPLTWEWDRVLEGLAKCFSEHQTVKVNNLWYERPDGKEGFLSLDISPIIGEHLESEGVLILGSDITDIKVLEAQLAQTKKLESVGLLAAGIAHEINTPIQYVGDTVTFLRDANADLMRALDIAADHGQTRQGEVCVEEIIAQVRACLEEVDYPFLKEEMPKSFARALEGVDRVSTIVKAMRSFSHPGESEKKAVDLNQAIENTLIVSRNEWKYVATIETNLTLDLPQVVCLPGEMNQVLLNLVVNAAHAVGDVIRGTGKLGVIRVKTVLEDGQAHISISDSGTGIPEALQSKIFDPFFTTKDVGKGTGQGLTLAYDIVVNKHGGTIFFDTREGVGTTFHVVLPIGG